MKTKTAILLVVAALLAEGAVVFALWPATVTAGHSPRATRAVSAVKTDESDAATVRDLRKRVHELEARLAQEAAAAKELIAEDSTNRIDEARGRRRGPPSMKEMRANMEKMKAADPERFAQMTNNFAKRQTERATREAAKADFLSSVDTSKMTATAKEVHTQLLALTARQQEIETQLHSDDTDDDTRQTLFNEMRQNEQQLRTLAVAERETLLTQTAESLGYTGDDATEIVSTIQSIYSSTETHGFHGPGGDAGGPPPQ